MAAVKVLIPASVAGLVMVAVPGPVWMFWVGVAVMVAVVGWLANAAFDPMWDYAVSRPVKGSRSVSDPFPEQRAL